MQPASASDSVKGPPLCANAGILGEIEQLAPGLQWGKRPLHGRNIQQELVGSLYLRAQRGLLRHKLSHTDAVDEDIGLCSGDDKVPRIISANL